jgi:YVTN family beta-propeller protein
LSDGETRAPAPGGPGAGADFAAGSEFAGHRIEAEIGRGGMGVVYRARHLALDRERALKVVAPALSADPRFRERFRRESRLAASIEHPNLIPVHHAGEESGRLFISMRLVDGPDLQREVSARGPLEPERAAAIVARAAGALDAAHAAGLVHRDVKPANVLLEPAEGASDQVFLTDFGISRTAGGGETITSTGEVLGSPDYVAPEQIEPGEADARSDIYSLGAVLDFALTGAPPFARPGDMAKLYAHANAPRPRPSHEAPWLPAAIDEVVAKAMAINPRDRYGSAAELAAAAGVALAGAPSPPAGRRRRVAPDLVTTRGLHGRRWLAGAGVALALAASTVALALLSGEDEGGDDAPGAGPPAIENPRAVATIPVGGAPGALTVGDASVWVASAESDAIFQVDPALDRADRVPQTLGGMPRSVAVAFGSVWVAVGERNEVLRLEPADGTPPVAIAVGDRPADLAVDDEWVWVANEGGDTVTRIDPQTNRGSETVPVGDGPRAIATGADAVWVTNINDGTLSEIDPQAAKTEGRPVEVGQRPSDVAVGGGTVWAMDNFGGVLTPVDPRSLEAGDPIAVDAKPRGVKFGFGYVWVASGGEDSVDRIDPGSHEVVGPAVRVGDEPADIAVGGGSVWTSDSSDATVTRIDPGRAPTRS